MITYHNDYFDVLERLLDQISYNIVQEHRRSSFTVRSN